VPDERECSFVLNKNHSCKAPKDFLADISKDLDEFYSVSSIYTC